VEALKAEITTLMEVGKHPNVVELKDVFLTDHEVLLVMELLRGGELFERMERLGPFSEVSPVFFKIFLVLTEYTHSPWPNATRARLERPFGTSTAWALSIATSRWVALGFVLLLLE
jgi:hypothetical protein